VFPIDAFQSTLIKLVEILEANAIRFHLTGGITSVAYAEPRLTQDVDIVIDNSAAALALDGFLISLSQSDFMFDENSIRDAIKNKRLFQLLDRVETLKIDLYPRELVPGELSRSVLVEVFDGVRLPLASRIDAAVSKLVWINKGSHKSRRDFRQIFQTSSGSEQLAIRNQCELLGLSVLSDDVLNEPDELLD